jgi:hypothetical protein
MFPKFRLENSDESFYKKLLATNQLVGLKKDPLTKNIVSRSTTQKNSDLNPERAESAA